MTEKKVFTLKQVAQHKSRKDCWLVINGRVIPVVIRHISSIEFLHHDQCLYEWILEKKEKKKNIVEQLWT